ncbi:hypothetical protein BDF19DRAFT_387612 [Syncephalis fuscata]|nr:hypothetical protein BDF19DRAFT_387612 [Syncephalis fuscata]
MLKSCTKQGVVALTFDDGPGPHTAELLDILAKEKVKATFYVVGENVENPEYQHLVKRAYDEGHQIASHTFDHQSMPTMSTESLRESMEKTEQRIYDVIKRKPHYVRPPYGDMDAKSLNLLKKMSYAVIRWNLDSNDWQYEHETNPQTYKTLYYNIVNGMGNATPQSSYLILMHDTQAHSVELIQEIIQFIRTKNLKFVTTAECIGNRPPAYHS